jgi:hypothetical protein
MALVLTEAHSPHDDRRWFGETTSKWSSRLVARTTATMRAKRSRGVPVVHLVNAAVGDSDVERWLKLFVRHRV